MRKIWPFTFYFLYFAAMSALMPYLVLYYRWRGMSGVQIGLLTGLTPIITTFGTPLWTGLADATRRYRLTMRLTLGAVIIVALSIPAASSFSALFPIIILHALMMAPVASLADSATMHMLGNQRDSYGRVRLGGTIGWGIVSAAAGFVIERQGLLWSFWLYAGGMALAWLSSFGLIFGETQTRPSIRSGFRSLLTNRRWLLFLVTAFVAGMGMSTINMYLFPYMEEAGIRKGLMGIAMTIATISEAPALFFSNHLLRHLRPRGLLILSMAVTGIRLLLYCFFKLPAAILAIQLLHGLTFATIWVAGVSYAYENTPSGMTATAQGMFGSMFMGFGSGAGGFLGGLLLGQLGTSVMYGIMGLAILVGTTGFLLLEPHCSSAPVEASS